MRFREFVFITAALMALACLLPRGARGGDRAEYVKIEVEDVSYLGGERYRIELLIRNQSGSPVSVRKVENEFSAQTEVIGKWEDLDVRTAQGLPVQPIPAGGSAHYAEVVKIPLDIPRLYINAFGDVNIRFTYRAALTLGHEDNHFERTGERFYWITPETDKWVLREGM